MEKKNLVKLALTAFAVAAAAPATVQADAHSTPTLLAKNGCGSGCGAASKVSYNDPYTARYYQAENYNYNNPNRSYGTTSTYDTGSDFNVNRGSTPGFGTETYRTYTTGEADFNANAQRGTGSYDVDVTRTTSVTVSENDLLRQISPQARAIYQSLDSEGKAIARQLAAQEFRNNKEDAIRAAQARINERRGMSSTSSSYGNTGTSTYSGSTGSYNR